MAYETKTYDSWRTHCDTWQERQINAYFTSKWRVVTIDLYTDADHASNPDDWRSVPGAIMMIASCKIHLHSRTRKSVALSSCESELAAASDMGTLSAAWHIDCSSKRSFLHRKGMETWNTYPIVVGAISVWNRDDDREEGHKRVKWKWSLLQNPEHKRIQTIGNVNQHLRCTAI